MALIKCIECGKEVSEFADSCPHCGCPVSMSINAEQNKINNGKYSVKLSQYGKKKVKIIQKVREITGFEIPEAKKIVDDLSFITTNCSIEEANSIKRIIESEGGIVQIVPCEPSDSNNFTQQLNSDIEWLKDINTPKCPKCGSTAISAVSEVYGSRSLISTKTVNRCANCGHTWEPGKKKRRWF